MSCLTESLSLLRGYSPAADARKTDVVRRAPPKRLGTTALSHYYYCSIHSRPGKSDWAGIDYLPSHISRLILISPVALPFEYHLILLDSWPKC
jgi:hypothetical protein